MEQVPDCELSLDVFGVKFDFVWDGIVKGSGYTDMKLKNVWPVLEQMNQDSGYPRTMGERLHNQGKA